MTSSVLLADDDGMIAGMVDWGNIDFVLLDMDGTLLDLHFDNYFWQHHLPLAYAAKHGMNHDVALALLQEKFHAKRGSLQWYCLDYWASELDLDIVRLKLDVRDRISVRPGAGELLSFLRKSGKRTVLLTNAHPKSMALKMQLTGLAGLLDDLISTHSLGFPKESPRLWYELVAQRGIDLSRSLFIDDTESILDAARDAGVSCVLGVSLPDSHAPAHKAGKYPLIDHFAGLYSSA